MSAVLIFTPISSGTISLITSQSLEASVRIPVAPIRGFKRIGGTTKSASLYTSPEEVSTSAAVVVVVSSVVSTISFEVSSEPPQAERIRKRMVKITKLFLRFMSTFSILDKIFSRFYFGQVNLHYSFLVKKYISFTMSTYEKP